MMNLSSLDTMSFLTDAVGNDRLFHSSVLRSSLRGTSRIFQRRNAFTMTENGRNAIQFPRRCRRMKALQRMEPFRKELWTRCLVAESSSSTDFNSAPSYGTAQNDAVSGNNLPQDKLQLAEEKLPFHNEKSLTSGRLFPSASRRSEVRLPGLALCLTTNEVLEKGSDRILDAADSAIAKGITIVILESRVEEASGGAQLYESACVLKALLRGRADLLVSERVDIAAAAGADGVLLSDKGLPALVARKMMQNANPDVSMLPLVARVVETTESALSATADEGADLLVLLLPKTKDAGALVRTVCQRVSIPVFVQPSTAAPMLVGSSALEMWQSGASGLVFQAKEVLQDNAIDIAAFLDSGDQTFQQRSTGSSELNGIVIGKTRRNLSRIPFKNLDFEAKEILEQERRLLSSIIDLVRQAAPEMEEISLLIEAVAQLDEPFLLVIVGEYNSGKSSIINALLGKKLLKEGILPTTNEITVLKYNGSNDGEKALFERHLDGHFIRYLSAELLKQMNLVDTPGTNVLLQRQERLTEEFVPRADLILFVLSADRPLTESEMSFLRYIRKWGKKVIFILNKVDIFSVTTELEEVVKFIRDNAHQLLGVENAVVYPVSARHALKAKIDAATDDEVLNKERLSENSLWRTSGFGTLEAFIKDFLDGSSNAGAERRRLKLETPISIAIELLAACETHLSNEVAKAEADMKILNEAVSQLQDYEKMMEVESTMYSQKVLNAIEAAKNRANIFVDSMLQLSNIQAPMKYLLRGDRAHSLPVCNAFDKEVIGSSISDVQMLLKEHQTWIGTKYIEQISSYRELVARNWPELKFNIQKIPPLYQQYAGKKSSASAVLDDFDTKAAVIVLEQEIKEVVLSTFGGLGAAGASASILTSILPNTVEDLIALAICSAGGMVGVWNLPLKRDKVKKKIQNVANSLGKQMESAMEIELKESIAKLKEEIGNMIQPCYDAVQSEVNRCSNLQIQIQSRTDQLHHLWLRIQNMGIR